MARMFEAFGEQIEGLMRDEPATAWRTVVFVGGGYKVFHCPAQSSDHPVRTAHDVEYAYSVLRNSCGPGVGGYYHWDGPEDRVGIVRRDDPTGCVQWENTEKE